MSKRTTKADVILREIGARVENAKEFRDTCKADLGRAQASYEAEKAAYDTVEQALARKSAAPKPAPSTKRPRKSQQPPATPDADANGSDNDDTQGVAQ